MDILIKKQYMIFNLVNALTKDNRPYLRMTLTDTDGKSVNAIMFDSNKLKFTPEKGQIVEAAGFLQYYNGTAQFKISEMKKLENVYSEAFLPKSSKNPNTMDEELRKILNDNIKTSYFKSLVQLFLNDKDVFEKFINKPAAKSVHHAYIHGLLEHSLSLIKLSIIIADYYGRDINKELLIIGALFHDVGKIYEIDTDNAFDYSDEGKLLGHLILGIELVNGYISQISNFPKRVKELIDHMIASHHGLLEFGSPKRPKTKEAMILHYIDNIDAKIASLDSIFEKEDVQPGHWSSYDRILERPLYRDDIFLEE